VEGVVKAGRHPSPADCWWDPGGSHPPEKNSTISRHRPARWIHLRKIRMIWPSSSKNARPGAKAIDGEIKKATKVGKMKTTESLARPPTAR